MIEICDKGRMNNFVLLLSLLSVFVLTSTKKFDGKHGTKLLVVTGIHLDKDSYPESEVIDLESDTGGDCHGWTEFPYGLFGGTGALFNTESTRGTEGSTFLVIHKSM